MYFLYIQTLDDMNDRQLRVEKRSLWLDFREQVMDKLGIKYKKDLGGWKIVKDFMWWGTA